MAPPGIDSTLASASLARLEHVYWIGGATDAGKTSVVRVLSERLGWTPYHYDEFDHDTPPGHWSRRDAVRHPAMTETRIDDPDWMWVDTTPERLVDQWLATTLERFSMVLEDLLALPVDRPILAEGYGFLPALVQPLLPSPGHAIWLVSSEAFKRSSYARRGKGEFEATRDPERARRNHIERDLLLAELHAKQAADRGLTTVVIDGTRLLEDIVDVVEAHFRAAAESSS